jgi:putative acetyltransferase
MIDLQMLAIRRLEHKDVHHVLQVIGDCRRGLLEPSDYNILQSYRRRRSAYFVAVAGDQVVGGAGIAPLSLSDGSTCELQRMYVSPASRGLGIGGALMTQCLRSAREFLYRRCYLEATSEMAAAVEFYQHQGFRCLPAPEGVTGNPRNDRWMMLQLQGAAYAI